jgi:hypothetical protein
MFGVYNCSLKKSMKTFFYWSIASVHAKDWVRVWGLEKSSTVVQ